MQDMNEICLVPNVILFNILLNKMHYSCNYTGEKPLLVILSLFLLLGSDRWMSRCFGAVSAIFSLKLRYF